MKKKICGDMFPGIEYKPMKKEELKKFVLDIQRFGFTQFRKERLLQAVGRFCSGAAVSYVRQYKAQFCEFTGAAWEAIQEAINHYNPELEGGFLTLLAFWLRNNYNRVIYTNYLNKKYSQDKSVNLKSIYAPCFDDSKTLIIDTIKDTDNEKELENKHNEESLNKLINNSNLNKKEKDIVNKLSFGYNLSEIAEIRGISKERVRQIRLNAIKKIKENLNTK